MYQTSIGFKMTEDGEYQKYKDTHKKLGYISFGTYMTAASLSIFVKTVNVSEDSEKE